MKRKELKATKVKVETIIHRPMIEFKRNGVVWTKPANES